MVPHFRAPGVGVESAVDLASIYVHTIVFLHCVILLQIFFFHLGYLKLPVLLGFYLIPIPSTYIYCILVVRAMNQRDPPPANFFTLGYMCFAPVFYAKSGFMAFIR